MLKNSLLCKKDSCLPRRPPIGSARTIWGSHGPFCTKEGTNNHGRDIPDAQGEIPMVGISQMHKKDGLFQIHSQKAQPTSLYLRTLGLTGPKWLGWKGWACSQYNGPEAKRESLGDHCPLLPTGGLILSCPFCLCLSLPPSPRPAPVPALGPAHLGPAPTPPLVSQAPVSCTLRSWRALWKKLLASPRDLWDLSSPTRD